MISNPSPVTTRVVREPAPGQDSAVFDETVAKSGREFMFAINIPQEAVVIPETVDAIRAALSLQTDRLEAVGLTNRYLGLA